MSNQLVFGELNVCCLDVFQPHCFLMKFVTEEKERILSFKFKFTSIERIRIQVIFGASPRIIFTYR